jgi:hypothetical protein
VLYLLVLLVLIATFTHSSVSFADAQKIDAMKNPYEYFAIQDTMKSEPDTVPGHEQYHQVAVALPQRNDGSIYVGQLSYSASTPVAVLTLQPIDPVVASNATALPLTSAGTNFTASFSHSLQGEIAGNQDFAGSSLYFHSQSNAPFTVSYTVVGKLLNSTGLPE